MQCSPCELKDSDAPGWSIATLGGAGGNLQQNQDGQVGSLSMFNVKTQLATVVP
jgi:hypothetical protein